jgi:hypothetical protein
MRRKEDKGIVTLKVEVKVKKKKKAGCLSLVQPTKPTNQRPALFLPYAGPLHIFAAFSKVNTLFSIAFARDSYVQKWL